MWSSTFTPLYSSIRYSKVIRPNLTNQRDTRASPRPLFHLVISTHEKRRCFLTHKPDNFSQKRAFSNGFPGLAESFDVVMLKIYVTHGN
jgi:hypothetical protein